MTLLTTHHSAVCREETALHVSWLALFRSVILILQRCLGMDSWLGLCLPWPWWIRAVRWWRPTRWPPWGTSPWHRESSGRRLLWTTRRGPSLSWWREMLDLVRNNWCLFISAFNRREEHFLEDHGQVSWSESFPWTSRKLAEGMNYMLNHETSNTGYCAGWKSEPAEWHVWRSYEVDNCFPALLFTYKAGLHFYLTKTESMVQCLNPPRRSHSI